MTTKFPDSIATTSCPVVGCPGLISIELQITSSLAADGAHRLEVKPSGFSIIPGHIGEHPEIWLKLETVH